jgi:hypothetical protein
VPPSRLIARPAIVLGMPAIVHSYTHYAFYHDRGSTRADLRVDHAQPASVGASVRRGAAPALLTNVGHFLVGAQCFVALRAVAKSRVRRGQRHEKDILTGPHWWLLEDSCRHDRHQNSGRHVALLAAERQPPGAVAEFLGESQGLLVCGHGTTELIWTNPGYRGKQDGERQNEEDHREHHPRMTL